MGKWESAGRRRGGEFENQTSVFSTRIRPELRKQLVESAGKNNRSLSQEVEHRLRDSFLEDEKIENRFGSRKNYAIMRTMASLAESMINIKNRNADWVEDPYLFGQVAKESTLFWN